jgi:hypothetical protein
LLEYKVVVVAQLDIPKVAVLADILKHLLT